MKPKNRLVAFVIAIAVSIFGRMLASGEITNSFGLTIGSILFGVIFGAFGALTHLAGRSDYVTRIGTVVILFLGGIAVFTPHQTAITVVPAATCGILLGFALCVGFLSVSSEGSDES